MVFVNSGVGPFIVFNIAYGHSLTQQHRFFLGQVFIIHLNNKVCDMKPDGHHRLGTEPSSQTVQYNPGYFYRSHGLRERGA
jgi:hypothetical protein